VNEKERKELEGLLLQHTKSLKPELESMLRVMNDHWTYEDPIYRFYHQSFKVYSVQETTERAVELLKQLLPGQPLNVVFVRIVSEGTGHTFEPSHNQNWEQHTRPLLEAFFHVKFMIEMAVRYADLPEAPQPMPSGWAALLYLFNLR
jgi:hypothetical protein